MSNSIQTGERIVLISNYQSLSTVTPNTLRESYPLSTRWSLRIRAVVWLACAVFVIIGTNDNPLPRQRTITASLGSALIFEGLDGIRRFILSEGTSAKAAQALVSLVIFGLAGSTFYLGFRSQ